MENCDATSRRQRIPPNVYRYSYRLLLGRLSHIVPFDAPPPTSKPTHLLGCVGCLDPDGRGLWVRTESKVEYVDEDGKTFRDEAGGLLIPQHQVLAVHILDNKHLRDKAGYNKQA